MSSINGVGSNPSIQKIIQQPVQKQAPAGATAQQPIVDKLELSGTSEMFKILQRNDIRPDKVAQVRAAIESGKYEDDHKLDVAADRLLDDIAD